MRFTLKKTSVIILIFVVLILTFATLLPLQSNVVESIQFQSNADAIFRHLVIDSTWHQWWPGKTQQINQKYQFTQEGFTFSIHKTLSNTFELQTFSNSFEARSTLRLTSSGSQVFIELTTSIPLSLNPIRRISELALSVRLKKCYKKILLSLSYYFSVTKNLYGFDIKQSTVPYEYVTALSKTLSHEPSISEIYLLIAQVKAFVKDNDAVEQGAPMLFFKKLNKTQFFVQVAIPTNKRLPMSGDVKSKWMLKGGFILTAKVTGGRQVILGAMKKMEQYIEDNHRNSVAIPFEYLITNRLDEPDSSKWITEVCYPVI